MSTPAWKSLVESLRARKVESPYLDRLEARLGADLHGAAIGGQSLERELLEEMAHALSHAEDKVNVALLELEVAGREHDGAADKTARERARRAYNEKREVAVHARWELMIHREALGFR